MSPIVFRRKAVRCEKSLGERLRGARGQMKLALADVEQATRVRAKYLVALENGAYESLPEDVYTYGFVQRYAKFLGLDSEACLGQYRGERLAAERLSRQGQTGPPAPTAAIVRPVRETRLWITPKLFVAMSSVAVVVGIAGYLWYQVRGFLAAPMLEVAQAAPELVVSSPSIEISGQTDGYAFVTINAEPVDLDLEGKFSQQIKLAPGMNMIQIAARNRLNKETRRELRVLKLAETSQE